jgi:hypothetical protein
MAYHVEWGSSQQGHAWTANWKPSQSEDILVDNK